MIKFGPAGTADSFKTLGYKDSSFLPEYLERFSLNAFEYQCGRGVNVNKEKAAVLNKGFGDKGITVSLHSPYYISLSSVEKEKRDKSIDYILQSARAVKMLGGNRIVVHSGSCSKISREEATALAKDTLERAREALVSEGLSDIHICPETMGKINQLGTLEEVIELCKVDDSFIPCIDFGHLNARTLGEIKSMKDYEAILNLLGNELGEDRLKVFHSHFSKIEYSAGGEVRHLTFADEKFGPSPEILLELIYKKNLEPTFICESAGTQTEDALYMKNCFYNNK
jgi:deoxyribonuclease-4